MNEISPKILKFTAMNKTVVVDYESFFSTTLNENWDTFFFNVSSLINSKFFHMAKVKLVSIFINISNIEFLFSAGESENVTINDCRELARLQSV